MGKMLRAEHATADQHDRMDYCVTGGLQVADLETLLKNKVTNVRIEPMLYRDQAACGIAH